MALINCPKCSHVISDKAHKCINCGYKIKKSYMNKKAVILLCTCLLGIILVLFLVTFLASQVSIKQYFNLISEKNITCIVGNHQWQDATCEMPRYCSICDLKKGNPIGHKWKDANCINPKTCLRCKKTDGDALGHTVNIGHCDRCKEYVNKYDVEFTVIKESMSCLERSFNNISDYFSVSSSPNVELYYCNLAKNEALNIKDASCIARDMCGNIQEFAILKERFNKIDNSLSGQIDTDLTIYNYYSYGNTLFEKVRNAVTAYNEAVTEINRIIEE